MMRISRCKPNEFLIAYNVCAVICDRPNDSPIASFEVQGVRGFDDPNGRWELVDNSTYFDDGLNINQRQGLWRITINGRLFYDFGFGVGLIPELANNSTYENLILGNDNIDIINFINSQPNVVLTVSDMVRINYLVKDSTGIQSNVSQLNYTFSI